MTAANRSAGTPVLDVKGLETIFHVRGGAVHAVNDVSFHIREGEPE